MSLGEQRDVGAVMRKAFGLKTTERRSRTLTETPFSEPKSGERVILDGMRTPLPNPLADATFRSLRELRKDFGRGGLPPREQRTPEDEARIATFCVLQELAHILDQFRRAIEQGENRRLVVSEHGRRLGKVVIEITIEDAHQ